MKKTKRRATVKQTKAIKRKLNQAEKMFSQGHFSEALPIFVKLLESFPDNSDLLYYTGYTYYACKQYNQAARTLQMLLNNIPDHEKGRTVLLASLKDGYITDKMLLMANNIKNNPLNEGEHLQAFSAIMAVCDWENALPMLNRCVEDILQNKVPAALLPGFLLESLGISDISCETMSKLVNKVGELSTQGVQQLPVRQIRKTSSSRIKLAYLSADFRSHPVGYFIYSILAAHNKDQFEIYCYYGSNIKDTITNLTLNVCEHFIDVSSLNEEEIAQMIHKDGIDILVDLGGYTESSKLKALSYRPAPVSIEYLGYANSTGNPYVDFRISDPYVDVADGTQYTETLLTMPNSFLCFSMHPDCPRSEKAPISKNNYITFGSFNHPRKLNPSVIKTWSSILKQTPNSHLVLKGNWRQGYISDNILKAFSTYGIDSERITFLEHTKNYDDHVACYNDIDIALDTFPYTGTTTTCEALWMGVPVITLVGKAHQNRVSYSILKNIGFEETICHTIDAYIEKAVDLATNPDSLTILRPMLHTLFSYSPITQPQTITHQIEKLYFDACNQKGLDISKTTASTDHSNHSTPPDNLSSMGIASDIKRSICDTLYVAPVPKLRLIHNLSRSGGTLICRGLGCMENITLLSEIHPDGSEIFNPLNQAHEWHHLFNNDDIQKLQENPIDFVDSIKLIEQRCKDKGKTLIIRDWAHLDFIGVPFLQKPTLQLQLSKALYGHFELIQLVIVRHPIDLWLSLERLDIMADSIKSKRFGIDEFLNGYAHFVKQCTSCKFIRYEDFTNAPSMEMRQACTKLDISFDEEFINKWYSYTNISGDLQPTNGGLGTRGKREIRSLPRRIVKTSVLARFKANTDYQWIINILKYDS